MTTATAADQAGAPGPSAAERWVSGFAAGWRAPSDADSFSDHFEPLLSDEIRLIQPQLVTTVGKRAFREDFARPLFSLLGEVRGSVESWAASTAASGEEIVFVELTIRGRLGGASGRDVTLTTIDRITLRDGLATERRASLDPLELLGAVAITPRAWPAFLRIQGGQLLARLRS